MGDRIKYDPVKLGIGCFDSQGILKGIQFLISKQIYFYVDTSTLNSKTNSSNIIILIFIKFNHPIKVFPRWEKVFVVHLVTDEMFGKGSLWKGNE